MLLSLFSALDHYIKIYIKLFSIFFFFIIVFKTVFLNYF